MHQGTNIIRTRLKGKLRQVWRIDAEKQPAPCYTGKIKDGREYYLEWESCPLAALQTWTAKQAEVEQARARAAAVDKRRDRHQKEGDTEGQCSKRQRNNDGASVPSSGQELLKQAADQSRQLQPAELSVGAGKELGAGVDIDMVSLEMQRLMQAVDIHQVTYHQLRAKLENDFKVSLKQECLHKVLVSTFRSWLDTHPHPESAESRTVPQSSGALVQQLQQKLMDGRRSSGGLWQAVNVSSKAAMAGRGVETGATPDAALSKLMPAQQPMQQPMLQPVQQQLAQFPALPAPDASGQWQPVQQQQQQHPHPWQPAAQQQQSPMQAECRPQQQGPAPGYPQAQPAERQVIRPVVPVTGGSYDLEMFLKDWQEQQEQQGGEKAWLLKHSTVAGAAAAGEAAAAQPGLLQPGSTAAAQQQLPLPAPLPGQGVALPGQAGAAMPQVAQRQPPTVVVTKVDDHKLQGKAVRLGELLGEGGFASVYKGYIFDQVSGSGSSNGSLSLGSATAVAVKVFVQQKNGTSKQRLQEMIEKEFEGLRLLQRQPAVVRLLGEGELLLGSSAGSSQQQRQRCAVLELLPESLADMLSRARASKGACQALSEAKMKELLRPLLHLLDDMHTGRAGAIIVHRDIKPLNILVRGDGTLALADFGGCHIARASAATAAAAAAGQEAAEQLPPGAMMTHYGTPLYMASEVAGGAYDASVDVFAFGVTVMEMMVGGLANLRCTPVNVQDMRSRKHTIASFVDGTLHLPDGVEEVSDEGRAFVGCCCGVGLQRDAAAAAGQQPRLTPAQLLATPWMQEKPAVQEPALFRSWNASSLLASGY